MINQRTAILLFSRSLEDEFRAKSFGLKMNRFKKLYQALLNRTRHTINSVALPVFEINSHNQVGDNFGERLSNAILSVKEQGFERIIVVGNDAPSLNGLILHKAVEAINSGDNVLGKDEHGGCYLIGLDTTHVDLDQFKNVDWHSNRVYDQLSSLLNTKTELPRLTDLNNKADLKRISLVMSLPRLLLILLQTLLFGSIERAIVTTLNVTPGAQKVANLRGPPLMVY